MTINAAAIENTEYGFQELNDQLHSVKCALEDATEQTQRVTQVMFQLGQDTGRIHNRLDHLEALTQQVTASIRKVRAL